MDFSFTNYVLIVPTDQGGSQKSHYLHRILTMTENDLGLNKIAATPYTWGGGTVRFLDKRSMKHYQVGAVAVVVWREQTEKDLIFAWSPSRFSGR